MIMLNKLKYKRIKSSCIQSDVRYGSQKKCDDKIRDKEKTPAAHEDKVVFTEIKQYS